MRILVVGADSKYAIERPYIKHLSQIPSIDCVDFFTAQNRFLEYYNKSIAHKVMYRFGFSRILREINAELIEKIAKNKPDIVFVFKGMEVFPETLKWIRSTGVKLVNYNPDNPFIFSGKGSGNRNITQSISLYDLHLTYDSEVKYKIEKDFGIACSILPFGFDLSFELFADCQLQEEISKVCFLGSPDLHRAAFINSLARNELSIDVYGQGWNKFVSRENIKVHDAVYDDVFWRVLQRYRVQLNLMRPHNPCSHNMRTFEIPGVGGIQLAPNTRDHATYFKPDSEIFLFKNLADCSYQISRLLNLTAASSVEIRQAARQRSLTSGYSYLARAQQVFKAIEKLMNE